MDKETIMDYVMETPTNTNPRILGQMLDEYSEGGGEGGSWKYYVVHSEDFAYLYLKDSAGNFVSYDQFINDIAAVAFVDASHESELGDIVRSYQLMYFADITADPGDVRFFWPGRNNGTAVTLINFRSIDGKLRAAMPL